MERDLQFGLDVLDNALINANPQEFYSRAYIDEDIVNNFRTLPGIKNKTKLAYVLFGSLLKKSTCAFAAAPTEMGAVDIDVEPLSAMAEICQFEIEQSWLSTQMAPGSNGDFTVASFMSHYWAEMAMEIREEIELIRWQGDKAGTFDDDSDFLKLADGYEKSLDNAVAGVTATLNGTGTAATTTVNVGPKGNIVSVTVNTPGAYSVAPTTVTLAGTGEGEGATFTVQTSGVSPNIAVTGITVVLNGTGYPTRVIKIAGTVITQANVIAEIGKLFAALPKQIRRRKDLLRLYVPPAVADFYRLATASANNLTYITKALDLTYLDIPMVVQDGMSDNAMVLTRWTNMIYAFDGAGDQAQLKAINLAETVAEPWLRTRVNLKVGFHIINHHEIVYYNN